MFICILYHKKYFSQPEILIYGKGSYKMGAFEIILTAFALSMDAFAAAICRGLSKVKRGFRESLTVGVWFGIFQGLMLFLGFFIGAQFADYVLKFDHWIAFLLLLFIGVNMIKEAFEKKGGGANVFILAVATSIDALAVGISFSILSGVDIFFSVFSVSLITFILSFFGVRLGSHFGRRGGLFEVLGGGVLILIGFKILIEHIFCA